MSILEELEADFGRLLKGEKEMSSSYISTGAESQASLKQDGELARLADRIRTIVNDAGGAVSRLTLINNNIFGVSPPEVQKSMVEKELAPNNPHITVLDNWLSALDREISRIHTELNRLEKL